MNASIYQHRKEVICFLVTWLITCILMVPGKLMALQESSDDRVVFVRVYEKVSQDIVGALVSEDDKHITLNDLHTGKDVSIQKTDRLTIQKPIDINDAARYAGLPTVVAWRLSRLAARGNPVGKIALVSGESIYVTLGTPAGLKVGQKLSVYRNGEEIKHPDTGVVIGTTRSKVGQVEVVEVKPELSKTHVIASDEFETKLEIGDEVEPQSRGMTVAVSPICNEDGVLTTAGASIAEDLATTLVQRKISVVERSVIGEALAELAIQNTRWFDEKTSLEFGQLTGANYVLAGKIVPRGIRGTVYLRMTNVSTGEIVFAVSTTVEISNAKAIRKFVPSGSGVQTQRVVQQKAINLSGKKVWEDSGVKVEKGQRVHISGPDSRVNRNKRANYYGTVASVGALIAKIDDKVMEIDEEKEFIAPASGTIYLRNNLRRSPNHTVDIIVKIFNRGP